MNAESDSQSRKGVTLSIVGAVVLVILCGGGIYLYHQIETSEKTAPPAAAESRKDDISSKPPVAAKTKGHAMTLDDAQPPVSANTPATPAAQPGGITPIENKLNAITDCLNRFEDVQNAMSMYFSWREDGLQPPTCNEKRVRRGMPPVYPELLTDCESLISEAALSPPNHPQLEKAGKKWVKLLGKALPIMQRMNRYYAKKRYTEDDCFKGRVFHVQLMKKYTKLIAQYQAVTQLVLFQAQGGLQRCIERTKNQTNKAALHLWASLIQRIQAAMGQFYLENKNPHPDLDAISRIKSQLEAQMKSFNDLPQEMTDTHDIELFEDFLLATAAFRAQNAGQTPGKKTLGIHVYNGVPKTVLTGSLSHVLDTFYSLIKRYNFWAQNNCIMLLPCKDDGTCPTW